MQQLTATARELGQNTMFSATQAGEAMTYLGMAGWNSQQIMAGMPGLLNLAAASNTDLARTADIVSERPYRLWIKCRTRRAYGGRIC